MGNRQDNLRKMELKKKAREDAGLVSDRFPEVSGMVIQMKYYYSSDSRILMDRTINVFPSSNAYFDMECMVKGCDGGGFDLSSIIAGQVKGHKKTVKGDMTCKGKNGGRSSDHAHISYEIKIDYKQK